MAVLLDFPDATEVRGTGAGSKTFAIARYRGVPRSRRISVDKGKAVTIAPDPAANVSTVTVTRQPSQGYIGVNRDGSVTVVMSWTASGAGDTGEVVWSYTDGTLPQIDQIDIVMAAPVQGKSWVLGERFYYLKKDGTGRFIPESGTTHRKHYIATDGKSRAAIAAERGVSEATITDSWLGANAAIYGYGESAAEALNEDAGYGLWYERTNGVTTSHHLYFKRGQIFSLWPTYDRVGNGQVLFGRNTRGESLRHPLFVGAYGTGDKPVLDFNVSIILTTTLRIRNILIQDVQHGGQSAPTSVECIIHDHCITGSINQNGNGTNFGFTLHKCRILDVWKDEPENGTSWVLGDDLQGYFGGDCNHLLIDGCLFDVCGYNPTYSTSLAAYPATTHPPSYRNHCCYMSESAEDGAIINTCFSRGSSQGAQMRPGGFGKNVLYLDNEIAGNWLSGNYQGAGPASNPSISIASVTTSAACKTPNPSVDLGGRGWGLTPGSLDPLVTYPIEVFTTRSLVCHVANPDDAAEISAKTGVAQAIGPVLYDVNGNVTKSYRWTPGSGATDYGVGGLNATTMNQTTIQRWTDAKFGTSSNSIDDLMRDAMNGWREQDDPTVYLHEILDYFRDGFSIPRATRAASATLYFQPDADFEGRMWLNPENWVIADGTKTYDCAGEFFADTVDLQGFDVIFSALSVDLTALTATSARLNVANGYLGTSTLTGGDIGVTFCGWLHATTVAGSPTINLTGTDAVATGDMPRLSVDGTAAWTGGIKCGQIVLQDGAAATVTDLTLEGGEVLFDDTSGSASLTLAGTTTFVSGNSDVPPIGEGRSGINEGAPAIASTLVLGGTLSFDFTGLGAGFSATIMSADTVSGSIAAGSEASGSWDVAVTVSGTNVTITVTAGTGLVTVG